MATRPGMSWNMDGMDVKIIDSGELVMTIFLGEAIEGATREDVEKHIKEIERCGYIRKWQKDKGKW